MTAIRLPGELCRQQSCQGAKFGGRVRPTKEAARWEARSEPVRESTTDVGFPSTGHIQAVKTDFGQCPVCEDTSCAPGRYHGKFFLMK